MSHEDPICTLIDRLCHTREQLANELGVSPAALYSWSVGRRTPRQSNRSELARIARAHARELDELANALDARRLAAIPEVPNDLFVEQQRQRRDELRTRVRDARTEARELVKTSNGAR